MPDLHAKIRVEIGREQFTTPPLVTRQGDGYTEIDQRLRIEHSAKTFFAHHGADEIAWTGGKPPRRVVCD